MKFHLCGFDFNKTKIFNKHFAESTSAIIDVLNINLRCENC